MNKNQERQFLRFRFFPALLLSSALGLILTACGERNSVGTNKGTEAGANNSAAANANSQTSGAFDPAKAEAEIAALAKQAEKSPGDEDVKGALSKAYQRRAEGLRAAGNLRAALKDYRSALRVNPDNEEAQQRAAEISSQIEDQPTGEYGEPAPLPISPNVTTDDADTPQPTPTKKP